MNMRIALLAAIMASITGLTHANNTTPALPHDANTTCPVMTQEAADPELFVDYKGTRVYLCCTKCKRKFRENPDLYMKRLNTNDKKSTASTEKKKAVPTVR